MDPLDEAISRGREGMARELHPAGNSGTGPGRHPERSGALADDPTATRDSKALPDAATTLPTPPQPPGDALDEPPSVAAAPSTSTSTRHLSPIDFVVTHPSQTRFTCPACKLTYTTHHSLVRHVGVSHARLNLNITFQCALCDYANANLRATANHYRLAHGAAVPPRDVIGSDEKACPFCPRTFPSTRSCAQHIREQHMREASEQRAQEAAEKEKQRGTATARSKWGEGEIGRFKEALRRLGPDSNAKLAEAIGTRDRNQVAAFKSRFFKAYPTWLKENYRPVQQTSSSRRSPTLSPASTQGQTTSSTTQPTNSLRSNPATRWEPEPRDRTTTPSKRGRGLLPTSPSPSPSTSTTTTAAGQQLASGPPTPTTSPPTATSTTTKHCSPGERAALSHEEGTPSPPPAPLTEETALGLQRLDRWLQALRSTAPASPDSDTPHPSPPPVEPEQPAPTAASSRRSPIQSPPSSQTTRARPASQRAMRAGRTTLISATPTDTHPEATPPDAPTPMARDTDREYGGLEREGDIQPMLTQQPPTLATPPATQGEGTPLPSPPPAPLQEATILRLRPLIHTPALDTFPLLASPPSPQNTPPPARVSERQHRSPGVGVITSQPPPTTPPAAHLTPPPSLGPSPPPIRAPGTLTRISIDPDRMDETLRHPFYQELTPFTGRHLGDFEWVAFEEVLLRWSTAIKEVVTAQRRRPPNPTSQWARRRRRREQEAQGARSPTPAAEPHEDPSQPSEEQGPTNNRASGRARRAAKARRLQKLYRANPGICMRQLLDNTPRVYCAITEPELVAHFTATFTALQPLGPPPAWLFPDRRPGDTGVPGATDEGDVLQSPVTPEEVVTQFKRTKRTAPGADGISYSNWRWVDPLGLILSTIYNTCRVNSRVPRPWKHSTVTLIHKGGDVTSVRNWRPISLQLTIYKLYSAIIARRIASWASVTSAFSDAQKGFLAYDGCAEHNFLLRSVMTDSRRRKKDVILTWLDLRDAFGSVPHQLLLSLMKQLGLSGTVLDVVRDIYSHSTIAVRTERESYTPAIPQNRGVKQGCPLSPILFNIAHEGLLRHLSTSSAGYTIAGYTINALAYADDVCVLATSRTDMQGILDRCKEFADWAGLAFNANKCGSLCLINHTSRLYVDHLYNPHLGTDPIPALSWQERYKYLGCPTGAYRTPTNVLNELRDNLIRDTGIVFSSELAEWQKLDAFRRFLFPRLCFAMKVVFPGAIWCKKLDTALRTNIKRGLHLPPRTCTKYFYLSQALGGLGIPSAEDESHVARAAQAFKYLADTRDRRIRSVALDQLTETVAKRAQDLDHTTHQGLYLFLNTSPGPGEGRAGDLPDPVELDSATISTRQHELTWDKRKLLFHVLKKGLQDRHLGTIKRSTDQGRAFHSVSLHPDSTFFTYTGAFLSFPQYRFIHRARLNLLPVRTVQARSHRPVTTTQCRICGRAEETLAHILNHCHYNLGMVRDRHNSILERIVRAVPDYMGTKMKEQAIPGTMGNNRPDLTITSPDGSTITIVEVSCPFESSPNALEDAAKAKLAKYEPLKQHLLQQHQHVHIYPFIVGSLGSWYPENDRVLSALRIGHRYAALMRRLCVVSAIAGSQNIWYQAICKSHHRGTPTAPDPQPTATTGGPAVEAPHPPEATPDAPRQ
ncbi:hypothetical protein EMCRGX_G005293 [Ephydatia muelleri]